MNQAFISKAKKFATEHPDILESWNRSSDILEQALALAVKDAMGV